ncbi:MAG: hypothetical protein MPJ04_08335 [Nitrosopumilus sp.]|nr:hypothetical protein [Nitrosopumilus sp.]MDA7945724.1 hypothetical protein [Nitrosopumilus sp.]MDA7955551.1 hypothetical protein [Nitrosopumilus sp.]MDA7997693.1 hypothetical protein [Nitrosopumilus sp.]
MAYKKSEELPDMSGILEDSQAARRRAGGRPGSSRSVRAALARLGLRACR